MSSMRKIITIVLFTLSVSLIHATTEAATCGCAGVPLLSAIDTSSTEPGDLFFNFTSENHVMNDLVEGSDQISDETRRQRSSASQAFSMSYGLAENWAVSGLIAYIEHSRKVGSSSFGEKNTSGLSDAVILFRYSPIYITPFSRHELSLGFGARLAVGKDDAGGLITASEDMQPSVGAPGGILWSSYSYAFDQAATLLFNASANYTQNDQENDRGYTFGDEFNFSLGMSQSIGTKFAYSAGLRYRTTSSDQRNDFQIPNTGGEWVDFVPAVQYSLTDKFDIGLSARVPVYRKLDGAIQFTTSYSYALTLSYAY